MNMNGLMNWEGSDMKGLMQCLIDIVKIILKRAQEIDILKSKTNQKTHW